MSENFGGPSISGIWDRIYPFILKSPVAVVAYVMTYIMGYGIAFLLFRYHRESILGWKGLYHVFGVAYTALIFLILNWKMVWDSASSITIQQIEGHLVQTLVIGLAILFIVMIVTTIVRDRGGKK